MILWPSHTFHTAITNEVFKRICNSSGAPNEIIVQNHLNIASQPNTTCTFDEELRNSRFEAIVYSEGF